ncbi:MAG: hypothetical protein V4649_18695 [Bacteroidota bacterium]
MKLLLLSLLAFCAFIPDNNKHVCPIKSIKVIAIKQGVDPGSGANVDCYSFEDALRDDLDTFVIRSHEHHKQLSDYINAATNGDGEEVDAKARMYIQYSSGKVDTLCLGAMSHFVKNGRPKTLLKMNLLDVVNYYRQREGGKK